MGTVHSIFLSILIVILVLEWIVFVLNTNIALNAIGSNLVIHTHMNDDIDLNNRTKDFGKSVKNKTQHLYTRIASDVQKVVNTKRNGNPFSVEEHHYMTVYPVGRLGNQLFQYAVLYAVTRTNHTWIP